MRSNKFLDDSVIIDKIFEIVKIILDRSTMNKKVISQEYSLELRDCLLWCINNFNESISLAQDLITTKTNKYEVEDQKRKDYNQMYDNCLSLMTNRILILKIINIYIEDSEVISGIIRTLRKLIQVLTNDKNIYLEKSKDATNFAIEFRVKLFLFKLKILKKLLVSQNDGFFIITIRTVMAKYYHYPEVHNNLLIILFQITNFLDHSNLILTAQKLNLEEFKECFDLYRGKLRVFCKLLNSLHLNILANLSDIAKSPLDLDNQETILKLIMLDIKALYRNTQSSRKRLEDFKTRKLAEVEIHETITRIGVNITKFPKLSYSLLESQFYDDIMQYLIQISNSNSGEKDLIQYVAERKKKNTEEVKRYILAIVENTQTILINIMNSDDDEISETFCHQILTENEIEDSEQLASLFESSKEILLQYGCSLTKLEKGLEVLKDMFEV